MPPFEKMAFLIMLFCSVHNKLLWFSTATIFIFQEHLPGYSGESHSIFLRFQYLPFHRANADT